MKHLSSYIDLPAHPAHKMPGGITKFISYSSVLCVFSCLIAVFSPNPVLFLAGCALCGLSVGILWPGVFSLAARYCPQGGPEEPKA